MNNIFQHKLTLIGTIFVIAFIGSSIYFRDSLLTKLNRALPQDSNLNTQDELVNPSPTEDPFVLGTSSDSSTISDTPIPTPGIPKFTIPTLIPTPTPYVVPTIIIPTMTPTPIPTQIPTPTPQISSNVLCTPAGDARYSNAYVNNSNFPGNFQVGSTSTITIVLKDCNGQSSLNSDTITITPNNVDSTFLFVGFGGGSFTLPQGQFSFQVTD